MKNRTLIPILLPTDDVSPLFLGKYTNNLCINQRDIHITEKGRHYHLYLTSDAEIKEGDYLFNNYTGEIEQNKSERPYGTFWKKIEFTTDSKLIADGVPAIDGNTKEFTDRFFRGWKQEEVNFLEEFCKRYNKKDNKKVDVEKLAEKMTDSNGYVGDEAIAYERGIVAGFEKCQALQSNAGGFSLEDKWRDMAIMFYALCKNTYGKEFDEWIEAKEFKKLESINQSLTKSQPKGDIVIELNDGNLIFK